MHVKFSCTTTASWKVDRSSFVSSEEDKIVIRFSEKRKIFKKITSWVVVEKVHKFWFLPYLKLKLNHSYLLYSWISKKQTLKELHKKVV
jgi:hypothetical protein